MLKNVTGRKILLVEDNGALSSRQAQYFFARGNTVHTATNLKEAKKLLSEGAYDAVILDLLLPDGEGLELFEFPVKLPPVIIQTTLSGDYDMLDGFSRGAADYIVKPCSDEVLEARLALRLLPKTEAKVSMHGLTADAIERTATYHGKSVALTGSEFNILYFFMTNPGRFFNAAEIYEKIWQQPSLKSTSVKYHISNLRQKLINITAKNLILTEFGKGYAFLAEKP